ncbi:MAG: hypothetical protein Q7T45_21265 [Bradyrhizobium sp.]|uniref:hypothetical protein n=1 Tax=Bradyrhizobium sp. TaxID=376 RepID=UPI00271D9298|nr:hypothetical protein [Bradyrhizobium sp.]MDO8400353.1 hypothetical protein [Bradyrhizobium sp.]
MKLILVLSNWEASIAMIYVIQVAIAAPNNPMRKRHNLEREQKDKYAHLYQKGVLLPYGYRWRSSSGGVPQRQQNW